MEGKWDPSKTLPEKPLYASCRAASEEWVSTGDAVVSVASSIRRLTAVTGSAGMLPVSRGLHPFTFQLNVSAFCETRGD